VREPRGRALGTKGVAGWCWGAFLIVGLSSAACWLVLHHDYYLRPLAAQALHPLHDELRSSGRIGLAFGVIGTLLFLVNLSYLLRRRSVRQGRYGSLRSWMHMHVASGLLGGACILLHSVLSIRSASGLAASAALGIVLITGTLGRYLYAFVPRSIEGRELELEEVRSRYERQLSELGRRGISLEQAAPPARPRESGRLLPLLTLFLGEWEIRRTLRAVQARLDGLGLAAHEQAHLRPLVKKLARQHQSLARYHELRHLMSSWRFLHRWLALAMLATAAGHVLNAVRFADLALPGTGP